jgi:transposase
MRQIAAQYKQLDVLPMVKHYMNSLDLYNLFKKYVPASTNCLAEHAESLCIITANIICDNKPLYKVQEWLAKYADGLTNESVNADKFNDDRLARSLSALFKADRHSLMTEISCNAIKLHKLLTDEIHNDSTTVTFIGQYANPDPDAVQIEHGHNKDFRPDCKQIVFGLNITADGHVPLSYKAYNGNRNDDTTHVANWNELRSLLQREDFIYIADCKLCSSKNLAYIDENNGYFITIIPKFHKESKSFIEYIKTNDADVHKEINIRCRSGFLKKQSRIEAVLLLYFFALMIVSLIERNIRLNMTKRKIEKLPILPQKMNTKKPTWNNIRYFCRNIHLSVIIKNKVPIQADVQGFSELHKIICELIEVPCSAYKNLYDRWWLFEGT